jgi:3-methylfumaryl-CoA hydratase
MTSPFDLPRLQRWIGRVHESDDVATVRHARLMAATVDLDGPAFAAGTALPPLWHWIYFLEGQVAKHLGRDGHPARGGFLPPVPLPNRMWAGGRVDFLCPVPLGAAMRKRSQVLGVEHKQGRSGHLVFVTVLHEVLVGEAVCVREEHDIVYRGVSAAPGGTATPVPKPDAELRADLTRQWVPTSTQLFRYSALTFNGHRIHYDLDYCRNVEGYDNLVVHGPLSATLLAELGQTLAGQPLRRFVYRGLRPTTLGQTVTLKARRLEDGGLAMWSELPDSGISMTAQAWT